MHTEYRIVKVYQNGHIWVEKTKETPDAIYLLDDPGIVAVMISKRLIAERDSDD